MGFRVDLIVECDGDLASMGWEGFSSPRKSELDFIFEHYEKDSNPERF